MAKRSNYEKRPRDFYPTPAKAVEPLQGVLRPNFTFCEPCAGNGALVSHLEVGFQANCFFPSDIEPQADWITKKDGLDLTAEDVEFCDMIITNPPFTWNVLKPLMDVWIPLKPTILLLPADFIHNIRFGPYLEYCQAIVSIGRVKWIEDSKVSGMENYMWAFFATEKVDSTQFIGRKKE